MKKINLFDIQNKNYRKFFFKIDIEI